MNGDGAKMRRTSDGPKHSLYKRVIEGADGYQLLCANCNWIKRHEEASYGGRPRTFA